MRHLILDILCRGWIFYCYWKDCGQGSTCHSYRFSGGWDGGRSDRATYQPHRRWLMSHKKQAAKPSLSPESICYFRSLSVSVSASLTLQLISGDRWGQIFTPSFRHPIAFSLACHQVYHPFLNESFIQIRKEPFSP